MDILLLLAIDCHIEKCNSPGLGIGEPSPAPQTKVECRTFSIAFEESLNGERDVSRR